MKDFIAMLFIVWFFLSFVFVAFDVWSIWTMVIGLIGGLVYVFLT